MPLSVLLTKILQFKKAITLCEGTTVTLTCPDKCFLNIIGAFYGRNDQTTCSNVPRIGKIPTNEIMNKTCSSNNVATYLNSICNLKQNCSITLPNNQIPDPCALTFKYYKITYDCTLSI